MKPITVWKRVNNETKQYEHNHIEDGHCESSFPNPNNDIDGKPFTAQSNWKNGKWEKTFAYLADNKVVYDS